MKMIRKIATIALGLACIGSSVFAQSLADAKKAIDVEQYQKAKAMLKNLTVTQAKDDETFFQLGWVYLLQDYIDSAKTVFNQGIAAHPKSALNYVGLGVAARLSKDNAGATSNFNTAMGFTGKKESKPWLYMGKGYLQLLPNTKAVTTADADAAIDALTKGKAANPKDAEVALELGNAYRSKRETGPAYENYTLASELDPKLPAVKVAQGVLYSNAHNFEDGIKQYQAALAIDPNYGPAYREWAETAKNWSFENRAVAVEKINEGVEKYKKYLSLTDESDETLMRYADFLISAGKWKELQEVSAQLAKSAGSNIRALRYLGYAGYENKDYERGMNAMRNWFAKAGPNRILPRDYFYRGRLELAAAKDTVAGVASLKKAADLDSTLVDDAYDDVIAVYKKQNNYLEQGKAYAEKISKIRGKPLLNEHFYVGFNYYNAFRAQSAASKTNPAIKPDSTLLVKADSALSYVQKKAVTQLFYYPQYRAYIADYKDSDALNLKGLAKTHYEDLIKVLTAKTTPLTEPEKRALADAYAYLGSYAQYREKDDAKALENFTKARELNPNNYAAKYYFELKAMPPQAPAPKKPTK